MLQFKSLTSESEHPLKILISEIPNFTQEEKNVAYELIETTLKGSNEYQFILAYEYTDKITLTGYICYGRTPMTASTFDLYWIAIHPNHLRKGIGRKLMMELVKIVKAENGTLLRLETSSQESYNETHHFYINCGFEKIAIIKDFYKKNDDLITYVKYL